MRLALLSFTVIACAPIDEPYVLRSIEPDSTCTTELKVGMPISEVPEDHQEQVLDLGGQRFACVSFELDRSFGWACTPESEAQASTTWTLELPYDANTLHLYGTRSSDGSEECSLHLTARRPLGFDEDAIEPIAIIGSVLLLGPPAGIYHTFEGGLMLPGTYYSG